MTSVYIHLKEFFLNPQYFSFFVPKALCNSIFCTLSKFLQLSLIDAYFSQTYLNNVPAKPAFLTEAETLLSLKFFFK